MSGVIATAPPQHRVPHEVTTAIAGAWALALVVETTGLGGGLHHDALIEHGPPLWVALPVGLLAWQVMTAAMMLPSSLPLVRLFARASAAQLQPRRAMAAFLGGYALVWTLFGFMAFLGDVALHQVVDTVPVLGAHESAIAGVVLALAGAFQFTPMKDACLRQCRHPGAFLLRYYERGPAGGFRIGARHGIFCVGCCWALMLVMFAVGVANLVWMAVLTALMVHEKSRPLGARSVPRTGIVLLAVAAVMLVYSAVTAGALTQVA